MVLGISVGVRTNRKPGHLQAYFGVRMKCGMGGAMTSHAQNSDPHPADTFKFGSSETSKCQECMLCQHSKEDSDTVHICVCHFFKVFK